MHNPHMKGLKMKRPYTLTFSHLGITSSRVVQEENYLHAFATALTDCPLNYSVRVSRYYQLVSDGERSVLIDEATNPLPGFSPRSDWTEADSWIAAKAAFGFELTELQKALHASQA